MYIHTIYVVIINIKSRFFTIITSVSDARATQSSRDTNQSPIANYEILISP